MATGRTFDGVDDFITTAVGACNFAFGPATFAAIVRWTDDTHNSSPGGGFDGAASDQVAWTLGVSNSGSGIPRRLMLVTDNLGGFAAAASLTLTIGDSWALIAVTKASGTVAPRFHKYVFSSTTWTHENSGSTIGNGPAATNRLQLGLGNDGGAQYFWEGDILISGLWNSVLSDGQLEGMTATAQSWLDLSPSGLWYFNQTATTDPVLDQSSAGTADQTAITGTAVGTNDLAAFSFGAVAVTYGYELLSDGNGRILQSDELGFILLDANTTEPFPPGYAETKVNPLLRM